MKTRTARLSLIGTLAVAAIAVPLYASAQDHNAVTQPSQNTITATAPNSTQTFDFTLTGVAKFSPTPMDKASKDKAEAEIRNLFTEWNTAVETRDPAKVTALYSPNAVLLPTLSNQVRDTPELIEDYFKTFLATAPSGRIDKSYVTIHSLDTASNVGTYTFNLVKDGVRQDVKGRYTFLYERVDGKWSIKHHHSSAMPEKGGSGH